MQNKSNRNSLFFIIIVALSIVLSSCNDDVVLEETINTEPEVQEVVEETKDDSVEVVAQEETKEVDVTSLYYWVNFLNYDGSVLQRTTYKYGETPSYEGDIPTYYDWAYYYTFIGWDKSCSTVYMT